MDWTIHYLGGIVLFVVCMQQPPISGPSCVDQSHSFPLLENWARLDIPDETLDRIGRYLG